MRKVMLVVGVAATLGCGGVSKEQYKASQQEAAQYKKASQDQATKVSDLEAKVTSLQKENATLKTHASDLEQKLGASDAAKTELQERAPVRLSEPVLFKEGSAKLTTEAKRSLDSMADAVSRSTDKSVLVSGFTDATEAGGKSGGAKSWQLSSTRALEVAKYLAGRGIDPTKVGVAAFGPARPVAPNDTLANKSLNRRVEIMLVPSNLNMGTIEVKPAELTPKP